MVAQGQRSYVANCVECHSIEKDGPAMKAPNLWGVMGRKAGSAPDYPYSDALRNSPVVWSGETLDHWLASPSSFIPDNMMPFVGIKDPAERAALIAYLAAQSDAR